MKLTMQLVSNDESEKADTTQVSNLYNSQLLKTQAKLREQKASRMPSFSQPFKTIGVFIMDLPFDNEKLKNMK